MRRNETPQLSQIMMVLQNINDHLRRIDDNIIDIGSKLNNTTQKHLVVIKKEGKSSSKEQK